jgi:hypothetical protein
LDGAYQVQAKKVTFKLKALTAPFPLPIYRLYMNHKKCRLINSANKQNFAVKAQKSKHSLGQQYVSGSDNNYQLEEEKIASCRITSFSFHQENRAGHIQVS